MDRWDAADLARCQECRALLSLAVEELEAAQGIAEKHPVLGNPALTGQFNEIRSEITRLTAMLDASTAFCRGMAARIGGGDSAGAEALGNVLSVNTQG